MFLKNKVWDLNKLTTYEELANTNLCLKDRLKLAAENLFFDASEFDYETSQKQSCYIDKILGFKVLDIEEKLLDKAKKLTDEEGHKFWSSALHGDSHTWVGLSPAHLQTPYHELLEILLLLDLPKNKHIVDLGSAYGRLGVVSQMIDDSLKFTGFEFVQERVNEGNRIFNELDLSDTELFESDISCDDFEIPLADVYFIYDFGKVSHIKKILKTLEERVENESFIVIARGRGVRSLIEYETPCFIEVTDLGQSSSYAVYSTNGLLDIY